MRLAHLHLSKPIPYAHSLRLQESVLDKHYAYNNKKFLAARSRSVAEDSSLITAPPPTLITFQSHPVYTVGRRHLKSKPLSRSQIDFLIGGNVAAIDESRPDHMKLATFCPSPRGGLLTYHAPGQLTGYLIVNLRTHAITPRCFVRLLENAVIRTCARHGVPNTMTTEDPGVWIGDGEADMPGVQNSFKHACGTNQTLRPTTRKICAIGVHVARGVTSHGIGLNILDAPIPASPISASYVLPSVGEDYSQPASGYLSWGFGRIVACGLEGKSVTWLTKEGAEHDTNPGVVAVSLAKEVCKGLSDQGSVDITGVDQVCERDVLGRTRESQISAIE